MLIFDLHVIGNNLLHMRKRIGMTQSELAEAAGLSNRAYADIERGTVNMRVETLLQVCRVLHITPDDILTCDETDQDTKSASILDKLNLCNPKDRETALTLLSVYLQSLNK